MHNEEMNLKFMFHDSRIDETISYLADEIEMKRHLMHEAIRLSHECITSMMDIEPGIDPTGFILRDGAYDLIKTPMAEILEKGLATCTMSIRNRYAIMIHIIGDKKNSVGMTTNMVKLGEDEKPLMYINGQWERHYAYHPGQLEPAVCEHCLARDICMTYNATLCNEAAHKEDLSIDEGWSSLMSKGMPYWNIQDFLKPDGESELLLMYWYTHKTFPSEKEWRSIVESNRKLIDMQQKSNRFDFAFTNENAVILRPSFGQIGFAVRQNGEELELCQYIDGYMMANAIDLGLGMEEYNPCWVNPVATGNADQILNFAKKYQSDPDDMTETFVIPFSMDKAVTLHGEIGANLGATKDLIDKYIGTGTAEEKKHALAWIEAMTREVIAACNSAS